MPMLDVFNDNAFSLISLTDAINQTKYVPGRIGQMGLFEESGVSTTSVAIERKNDQLVLVPPTPRGGPGITIAKNLRSALNITVPHFEVNDAVMAEEVQNLRGWGSETGVETVQNLIAERDAIHTTSMSATEEYSRIGAIKGIVTYAPDPDTGIAETLNLFTLFGVAAPTEVDLNLDAATDTGALRKACAGIVRTISNELGTTPFDHVHCFASNETFDALISNLEVRNSYKNTPMASVLREGYLTGQGNKIYGAFEFGGIVWENYRGSVDGQAFIATDKCHFFPVGVPRLFRTIYSPGDWVGVVNTIGQRLYQQQYIMQNNKGVHLDTQMNELNYVTRPRVLIPGKTT